MREQISERRRVVNYWITNVIQLSLAGSALFYPTVWGNRIFTFWTGLQFVLALLVYVAILLSDSEDKENQKLRHSVQVIRARGPAAPVEVNWFFDLTTAAACAALGWWFMAVAYTFIGMYFSMVYDPKIVSEARVELLKD